MVLIAIGIIILFCIISPGARAKFAILFGVLFLIGLVLLGLIMASI